MFSLPVSLLIFHPDFPGGSAHAGLFVLSVVVVAVQTGVSLGPAPQLAHSKGPAPGAISRASSTASMPRTELRGYSAMLTQRDVGEVWCNCPDVNSGLPGRMASAGGRRERQVGMPDRERWD